MIEATVVAARIVQFLAAMILFGTPLFFLYGLPNPYGLSLRWSRPLLLVCAVGVMLGALVSLLAQTAVMAGDPAAMLDWDTLASVLTESAFGVAILVRLAAATAALVAARVMGPGRGLWSALGLLGAVVLASFAWSGHGAAEEGPAGWVHAAADILHLLAAGTWMGALIALAIMVAASERGREPAASEALHKPLAAFSGVGAGVVATIVASGLINSWLLVGPTHVWQIGGSTYGRLLLVKLGLFAGMLGLAALNRYRLTPGLANGLASGDPSRALTVLRRSILTEAGVGAAILAVVGWLGTLAPVSAQ